MKTHKDLNVWKEGVEFTVEIYRVTKTFPEEELYGLASQLRRAAISVSANISEGSGRNYTNELIRFLRISRASLSESETLLYIARRQEYLETEDYQSIQKKLCRINAQISGLIRSVALKPLTKNPPTL